MIAYVFRELLAEFQKFDPELYIELFFECVSSPTLITRLLSKLIILTAHTYSKSSGLLFCYPIHLSCYLSTKKNTTEVPCNES